MKNVKEVKGLQIVLQDEVKFNAVVVGKDTMSSGLLADSLTQNLNYEAVGIRPTDLLEVLRTRSTGLVIINADIDSRSGSGCELANAVSRAYPATPIIILIAEPTREATINALRFGARGVFNQQMSMGQFIDCVETVKKGSIWAGVEESDFILEAFRSMPALGILTEGKLLTLSTRELQVVRSAASGKMNKAIASELSLSEHTVKNYLFRAFEKLGVSSRVELLFYLTMRGYSFHSSKTEQAEKTGADQP